MGTRHNRSLAFLLAGHSVSLFGINMSAVALPWYVLTTTGSPTRMAIVLFAQTLPYALAGLPAGVLVDRVNIKRLLVVLDVGRGVAIGLIPALAWFGVLEFWMIVGLAFAGGLLSAPYHGGRLSIIPAVVGEDEQDLAKANTLMQTAMHLASIAGPVLAGFLIPLIGNGTVILFDAVTYWIGALLVGFGVAYVRTPDQAHERARVLVEIREGLTFAWRHPPVRLMLLLGALAGLGFWLILDAALPVYTQDILSKGPEALGLLVGAWGVGAAVGMVVFGLIDGRVGRPRLFKLAVTLSLMAISLIIPTVARTMLPALVGLFLVGLFDGPSGVMVQTVLQHQTPRHLRGRVSTAFYTLGSTVAPVGLLVAGPVMERWGAVPIMWAVAVTFGLGALATWRLALSGAAGRDSLLEHG